MHTVKHDPNADLQENAGRGESLANILEENENVKVLVAETAEELSSTNAGIKNALEKSELVEAKAQEATDKLSVVNLALKDEIKERQDLEGKIAEVAEQGRMELDAALHDPLTGLPSRALFYNRLEQGFQHAKRNGWGLALLFIDLDGFKIINDNYGHDAGDAVLRTIAERLQENTRGADTVSRHGGDEFVILITEVRDGTDISPMAEKIMTKIQAPCTIHAGNLTLCRSLTGSIGIAIYPKDGETAEALVKSADVAMYEAKRNKSKYSFAR
jgi:diguanylate cyclase (GGDEF)-like protein